ncbi:MAG: metalloregulator ArsR/SmtB family transcription factor [bacterium]|nr:metalloregulator ArsR/SmtB family transcription factor [bacterium]
MKEYERILKALANRRRLTIVALLKKRNEATVSDIAESIKLSFTSTSKHLTILARVDILDKRQQGLEVFYFLGTKIPAIVQSVIARL